MGELAGPISEGVILVGLPHRLACPESGGPVPDNGAGGEDQLKHVLQGGARVEAQGGQVEVAGHLTL